MSWIATKYAWKCSHVVDEIELVKGSVKLLLLAIAYRVPKGYYETEPTSLRQFEHLTGMEERQVRRCREVLKRVGEIEQRGGKVAVYSMPRMVGPLFAVKPDKMSAFPSRLQPDKMSGFAPENPDKMTDKMSRISGPQAGGVLSLDLSTMKDLSTTTAAEETTAVAVEAFLDWFLAEYPKHRGGVLYTIATAVAEPLVRELLQGRSLERLRAMAVRMWAEREDRWVRESDYGLQVLKRRAAQLENKLVNSESDRGPLTVRRKSELRENKLARIIGRLQEHVDDRYGHAADALGRACAAAIAELQSPDPNVRRLDAMLFEAAVDVVDRETCEADAQEELREFRLRMSADQYDRSLRAAIDRQVRKRANLPDLGELMSAREATA